jgi:protein rIIB
MSDKFTYEQKLEIGKAYAERTEDTPAQEIADVYGITTRSCQRYAVLYKKHLAEQPKAKPVKTAAKAKPTKPAKKVEPAKPAKKAEPAKPKAKKAAPKRQYRYSYMDFGHQIYVARQELDNEPTVRIIQKSDAAAFAAATALIREGVPANSGKWAMLFEDALTNEVKAKTSDRVTVKGNEVFVDGIAVKDDIAIALLARFREGMKDELASLLAFMDKLKENPSKLAREHLWAFMAHNDIQVLPDGDVQAWKVVRYNYLDCHSGTMDNSVGTTVSMPREDVVEDPHQTCSAGLHVCAKSYIPHFARSTNRVVAVKVNPKDFVSIPVDYDGAKARVCRYVVTEDVTIDFRL